MQTMQSMELLLRPCKVAAACCVMPAVEQALHPGSPCIWHRPPCLPHVSKRAAGPSRGRRSVPRAADDAPRLCPPPANCSPAPCRAPLT